MPTVDKFFSILKSWAFKCDITYVAEIFSLVSYSLLFSNNFINTQTTIGKCHQLAP